MVADMSLMLLTVYSELQSEREEDNRVSRELIAERGNTAAVTIILTSASLCFHESVFAFSQTRYCYLCLQFFGTVGWVAGRASGL